MSLISKLWKSIRNPIRCVGRDLQGNKFYESPSPIDPERTKRTVQYHNPEDVWNYIGGGKRLAIQWSAWLTYTRKDPPTLEELEADLRRQQRVLANVAVIEARDRAEAEERLRIRQEGTHKALEEASARARGLLEQPTEKPGPVLSESTTSQPGSSVASTSGLLEASSKPKVLPPKFLTPATPRNPKGSSNFTSPVLDGVSGQESSREKAQANGSQSLGQTDRSSTPPPPMPSRLPSETESWTPVARRRG